nr:aspartate--tRNA ligase [Spirochaetota bacterium]
MFEERVYCGDLTIDDIGKTVVLGGWVDTKRDLGGVVFLELRDVTGIVQAVVHPASVSADISASADKVRDEYCVMIRGNVVKRTDETINPALKTGSIEVDIEDLQILNASPVPPFPLDSRESVSEDLRLKYRYLDLRRKEMKDAVIMRHRVMQETRNFLTENRFIEIETPMLNKSTPEGARDFLVPSRINRGMFFALPQSPQLFKQILMVSGFDRYFQIVKCFRDEDLRNDRQPEFTQIDLEMSFVTPDMVMGVIEGLLKRVVKEMTGKDIESNFKRLTYDEAMSRFGKDAPDMRFGLELVECSDIFTNSEFQVFKNALAEKGIIKGMAVADEGKISRKMVDDYSEF